MATPSLIMCPVLTGDTTLCPVIEGTTPAETCSFQLGSSCPPSGVCLTPNHGVFCHSHTQSHRGMPIGEVITAYSHDLGIFSIAPLPCLASNKVL